MAGSCACPEPVHISKGLKAQAGQPGIESTHTHCRSFSSACNLAHCYSAHPTCGCSLRSCHGLQTPHNVLDGAPRLACSHCLACPPPDRLPRTLTLPHDDENRRRPAVDEAMPVLEVTAEPVLAPVTPVLDGADADELVEGVGRRAAPLTAAL